MRLLTALVLLLLAVPAPAERVHTKLTPHKIRDNPAPYLRGHITVKCAPPASWQRRSVLVMGVRVTAWTTLPSDPHNKYRILITATDAAKAYYDKAKEVAVIPVFLADVWLDDAGQPCLHLLRGLNTIAGR